MLHIQLKKRKKEFLVYHIWILLDFFVTWLIKEHKFIPEEITKVCSYNPGKFISQFIENKYGKIRKGYEGSLTIIDMGKPVTITKKY